MKDYQLWLVKSGETEKHIASRVRGVMVRATSRERAIEQALNIPLGDADCYVLLDGSELFWLHHAPQNSTA